MVGPRVYSPRALDPGDTRGLGRTVAFHTRGWLPYTLRWRARVIEDRRPHGWTIEATGDLAGRGVWSLAQQGDLAAIDYDWRIEVEKPLLKPLTPLLKPVYARTTAGRWRAASRGCGASSPAAAPPLESAALPAGSATPWRTSVPSTFRHSRMKAASAGPALGGDHLPVDVRAGGAGVDVGPACQRHLGLASVQCRQPLAATTPSTAIGSAPRGRW